MSPRPQRPLEEYYIGEPNSGCWLWLGTINRDGYGSVRDTALERTVLAHRLVYKTLVGPIPPRKVLLHRCDNPCCVNPDHMCVGTTAENNADMRDKGRQARGTRHGSNKLSVEQVIAIREAAGTQDSIAARFNIHRTTVCQIKSGKRWKHLEQVS